MKIEATAASVRAHHGKPVEHPAKEARPAAPGDSVEISREARELAESNRNARSPAQRARALIASYEELAGRPFGRVVSALARGEDPLAGIARDPAEESPQPAVTPETASAAEDAAGVAPPEDQVGASPTLEDNPAAAEPGDVAAVEPVVAPDGTATAEEAAGTALPVDMVEPAPVLDDILAAGEPEAPAA